MNWYEIFYWLTVAENVKTFFCAMIWIFTIVSVVATIAYFGNTDDKDNQRMSRKWMWWSFPFAIVFWSLFIFTPNRKDALLIIAGGGTMEFLTNDSTAKQIPHELSNFVISELKNMATEAKVELNINSQKDKIIQEAKGLTTEELLKKMRSDTTYSNLLLESIK